MHGSSIWMRTPAAETGGACRGVAALCDLLYSTVIPAHPTPAISASAAAPPPAAAAAGQHRRDRHLETKVETSARCTISFKFKLPRQDQLQTALSL